MKTTQPRKTSTAYSFKVRIEPKLAKQMRYFVREVATECQWYTQVRREYDSDTSTVTFVLYGDIFIPPQQVGAEDVDMDPKGTMLMWTEQTKMLTESGLSEDEVNKHVNILMNSAWNWCHSHVSMPAKPSQTDNEQWRDWIKLHSQGGPDDNPPMMLILNKIDEVFVRVYDPVTRIQEDVTDVGVLDSEDADLAYVVAAIESKLEPIKPEKKEPVKPNTKYTTGKKQNSPRPKQPPLWRDNWNGGGGSQGLRNQLGKPSGGNGSSHQTVVRSFDSRPNYYAMLNADDKKKIEWALDAFQDGMQKKDEDRVNGALKTLFRWIDTNLGKNSWYVMMRIIEEYMSWDTFVPDDLKELLQQHDEKPDAREKYNTGTVLAEIVDYDDETVLELLDAMLVLNAEGVGNAYTLLEAFLFQNGTIPEDNKPNGPQNVEPAAFRILDD